MKASAIKYLGKPIPKGVNRKEFARGVKIEFEHTKNKSIAHAIAVAHVKEFKNYYNKQYGLPAMERRLAQMKR